MSNLIRYPGLATREPSPAIFGDRLARCLANPGKGIAFFDDFTDLKQLASGNTGQYASYQDTGVTIKGSPVVSIANGQAGVLEVAGNDATNDEGSIIVGGNAGAAFKITDDSGEARPVMFEARVKKASVDNTGTGFLLGLIEEGMAVADAMVDNTLEIASKDFVGWQCLAADGDAAAAIYRKAGQAKATVAASSAALVADTWIKLGFVYDPSFPTDKRIKFFVNGVEIPYYVTGANIAGATFPDGEELTLIFATKNALTNTESKLYLDWWAACMPLFQDD